MGRSKHTKKGRKSVDSAAKIAGFKQILRGKPFSEIGLAQCAISELPMCCQNIPGAVSDHHHIGRTFDAYGKNTGHPCDLCQKLGTHRDKDKKIPVSTTYCEKHLELQCPMVRKIPSTLFFLCRKKRWYPRREEGVEIDVNEPSATPYSCWDIMHNPLIKAKFSHGEYDNDTVME